MPMGIFKQTRTKNQTRQTKGHMGYLKRRRIHARIKHNTIPTQVCMTTKKKNKTEKGERPDHMWRAS